MESESFVKGMLKEARKQLKNTYWWQRGTRAYLIGWIRACEAILEVDEK